MNMYSKLVAVFILLVHSSYDQQKEDSLLKGFQIPSNAAKPRVWWHWMNGNITKEGIQKDLEWMNRVGIGGFQNFDASLFTPVVVPKKIVFMTPEWKDAFKFTTELADKKGLEMAIAGSPGWSVTGGPWVEPKDAMKKYVWTETRVSGGQIFRGKLSQPSAATGKFQNVELPKTTMLGETTGTLPSYYADAAVIAYRLPVTEKRFTDLKPTLTTSGGTFNLKDLTDGDLNKVAGFLPPRKVDEDMWIQYEFETPQTFKAVSITGAIHTAMEDFNGGPQNRTLKVSDDGANFKDVTAISGSIVSQNTVSFPATTARYWRMAYKTLPPPVNLFAEMRGANPVAAKSDGVSVAEFVLHTSDRIDQFEDKAGFTPWKEDTKTFMPQNADAIPAAGVIDLTSKMQADGSMNWTVPEGNWTIIRFGYSLTGRQNHPASPEATGLEVDKLDKEAVRKYINTYLDMYKGATGGMMGRRGLLYMVLDSYEAGHMTWTRAFPEEFKKRRGYDILNWLPVLTGRVIQTPESSEKFLWDFRKTIGELIAESHYDVIGEELHKRGMKRYTESHENKRIYLADGMDVKRNADIPMSAMWTPGSLAGGSTEEPRSEADIRESASVANIYGKPFVAAESMTSVGNAFSFHPEKLKRTADLEMASGLNRFVIHTSVHQPLDDKKPGFSLGPFGQYFTRQETWAEQSKAWMAYLGRSCYMLQQGKNIADILYFYGENNNITSVCETKLPSIPEGFEFDFVNASALLNAIEVKDGKLVAVSGNSYRALILDSSARLMTLPVLKKIKAITDAGIKVVGPRPEKSPSLSDNDAEFQKIRNEIWKNGNATSFESVNLEPDVIIKNAENKILFRHRKFDIDVYWLDNRSESPTNAEVSFKITGKVPELWNPQTGKKEKVTYQIRDGRTIVPLKFESWDAFFIVFRDEATVNAFTRPNATETTLTQISIPWKVSFNNEDVIFNKLSLWSENTNRDIKYFSGTATYENTFNLDVKGKAAYIIDLGEVHNIAEVIVNGRNIGIAWKKPFKLDISEAVKAGDNKIQVRVTNLWVNRLIGDSQPDVKTKTTFTTMPFYKANSPLLPSGLLGPFTIKELKN